MDALLCSFLPRACNSQRRIGSSVVFVIYLLRLLPFQHNSIGIGTGRVKGGNSGTQVIPAPLVI